MDERLLKGEISEMKVATKLKELGYPVLTPFGDNQRYDLVVDEKSEMTRMQVKTGNHMGDKIEFRCTSVAPIRYNNRRKTYTSTEIDGYAIYSPELEEFYWYPIDEAGKERVYLRIESSMANNSKSNWAHNYLLEDRFPELKTTNPHTEEETEEEIQYSSADSW